MAEVAGERGAANASVAHVVARSGVSRRTFYEVFSDREDCLAAAFNDAAGRAGSRVLPAYASEKGWLAQLRAGIAAFLVFLEEEPEMGRLLVVEALGGGPQLLAHRAKILERLAREIDRGRELARTPPPPLTAEGVLGGALALVHAHITQAPPTAAPRAAAHRARAGRKPPAELLGPLMGLIVGAYLGPAAARREIDRPQPHVTPAPRGRTDPLRGLDMRLTYRTVRVLIAIAAHPGASNRTIATAAGIEDQGQISKLLRRLEGLGLAQNTGQGHTKGEANAWSLTPRGAEVEQAVKTQTGA